MNELLDRYLFAATQYLKKADRESIRREMMLMIQEMLDERCSGQAATKEDLVAVLEELGDPTACGLNYQSRTEYLIPKDNPWEINPIPKKDCLLGQPYYQKYKAALKYLLYLFPMFAVMALPFEAVESFTAALDTWGNNILNAYSAIFLPVTVYFVLDYQLAPEKIPFSEALLVKNPYEAPIKRTNILCYSVSWILVLLLLHWPGGSVSDGSFTWIPLFRADIRYLHWYILLLACVIIDAAAKIRVRRYTRQLFRITVSTNCLSLAVIVRLLRMTPNQADLSAAMQMTFRSDMDRFFTLFFPCLMFIAVLVVPLVHLTVVGRHTFLKPKPRKDEQAQAN